MKKINESFVCSNCGQIVSQALKTCRNHCPFCFCSMHVDEETPGDRKSICDGKMFPVEYKFINSDYKILFECTKCHKKHWNKRSIDDEVTRLLELIGEYRKFFEGR